MTPERWEKVRDVLVEVLELAPEKRSQFLEDACQNDQSLRSEVETLLSSDEKVRSSFLQSGPVQAPALTKGTGLGDYEILSLVGSGGMGEVYRARDTKLKREVAIKVLPEFWSRDPERLHRFELEAQAAAALNHPNIISIYHVGQHDGSPYIVTELLQGETLRERLQRGPIPLRKAIEYAVQIATGLAAAHDRGIVHRDLKPENLFLTKDGRVKILDFGLARLGPSKEASGEEATVTQRTDPGVVLGTAAYMSPEQVRGKTVDHRADIFAFGTILYEMVTGKQPFRKSTSAETMTTSLNEEPPSISQITPTAPPGMQRVVHRCLEKDPEQRFHSSHDLAFALEALSDSTITTPSGSHAHQGKGWSRRRITIVSMTVLVLVVTYTAWWRFSKSHTTAPALSRPVHVTTYPGAEEDATLSPDGRQVAFSGNVEAADNFDIYVKIIGAEPPLRLTRHPDPDEKPIWSPDGRWIAFTRGGKKVLLVSPLGGTERTIAEGHFVTCAWSADSRSVIVEARTEAEKNPFLTAISIASGEQKRIVGNANCPATVSHSGSKLAYASLAPEPRLYVASLSPQLEVGRTRQIDWITEIRNILGCDWTENDRELVCALRMQSNDTPALWRIDTERPSPPQILPFSEGASAPVISPVSHRLVWDRYKADTNIWRAPNPERGGNRPAGLFISSTQRDGWPEYSPDGSRIAFVSARSGQMELWVADGNGSDLQMLTSMGKVEAPRWSPDGKSIVFAQGGKIYRVDSAGGIPKEVILAPGVKATEPSYSHDGTWIYFASDSTGRSEVWRVSTVTGEAVQVTKNGGALPAESPDGRFLFYLKTEGTHAAMELGEWTALYSQPSGGGPEQRVLKSSMDLQFVLAGGGLYFIRYDNPDHPIGIDFLDLRNGATRRVLTVNMAQRFDAPGLSVSPDGKWLLYALFDFEDDIMLFEDFH